MADVVTTVATVAGALKLVYGPKIVRQSNLSAFMFKEFDKTTRPVGGKGWVCPIQDDGGQSIGAYDTTEDIADSQAENVAQALITWKRNYALIRIDGDSMEASKRNIEAFVQLKEFDVKSKTLNLIADMNRQCYGDSMGEIADVLSVGTNTITFGTEVNMSWFRKGMKIDIFDATLASAKRNGSIGTAKQGRSITVINRSTRTITYSGSDLSGSIIATDRIFREDSRLNRAATVEGKELCGLRFLLDDGTDSIATLQAIDRSTTTIYKANRFHNSGTPKALDLADIQKWIDETEITGESKIDMMVMGHGVRRAYVSLLWFDVRYVPQQLKGGFQVVDYSGIPIYVDKDAPAQTVIGMSRDTIKRYVLKELGILGPNVGGSEAERTSHQDNYEILLGCYANLGTDRPNANFRTVDVQEAA